MDILSASTTALALHALTNQTDVNYPADKTICDLWDAQVAVNPDAIAVTGLFDTMSYAVLDQSANGLAQRLVDHGVQAGNAVIVSMDRSSALIVAVLAILKAGAAYLPVDKSWPTSRLADLAAQTSAQHCIADHAFHLDGIDTIHPDSHLQNIAPTVAITASSMAYLNFTSGSTGQPKGVPTSHQNVLRLVSSPNYTTLDHTTKMLHLAPIYFDAATLEIWGPLLNGGTCVLYPAEMLRVSRLRRLLRDTGVTSLFLTTALFNMIMDEDPTVLDGVSSIMTGGEAHSLTHIDAGFRAFGPDRLLSVYGPTESTTYATFYPITRLRHAEETALPIGKPIQNSRLYIIADDHLAEEGEIGEVCLAGPGLSAGYLNRPDLTAEKFVNLQIGGKIDRIYRTGDLGYLDAAGNTIFQGRTDDQVKVNGNRIELGEVQFHLLAADNVLQATVTVTGAQAGEKEVIAFVIPKSGILDIAALRSELTQNAPTYMIPSRIFAVAEFPLSPTGKVDKKALVAAAFPQTVAA